MQVYRDIKKNYIVLNEYLLCLQPDACSEAIKFEQYMSALYIRREEG